MSILCYICSDSISAFRAYLRWAFCFDLGWIWIGLDSASVWGAILGGLLLAVLLGWVLPSRFEDDLSSSGAPKVVRQGLMLLLRWVAPPVIAFGLLVSVWDLLRSWFG